MSSNIFDKPLILKKNEVELLKFLRANTNIESGGTKLYDGQGTHSLQNPKELVWLIKIVQKLLKNKKSKNIKKFEFVCKDYKIQYGIGVLIYS